MCYITSCMSHHCVQCYCVMNFVFSECPIATTWSVRLATINESRWKQTSFWRLMNSTVKQWNHLTLMTAKCTACSWQYFHFTTDRERGRESGVLTALSRWNVSSVFRWTRILVKSLLSISFNVSLIELRLAWRTRISISAFNGVRIIFWRRRRSEQTTN